MYSQNNIRQVPMNNFLGAGQTAYAVEAGKSIYDYIASYDAYSPF
jgi:hypothetical protein